MAQICPAKSTIVPFKKQMYSSGSIILSYKDDKCICVSIHAPTRGATLQVFKKSYLSQVSIHAPTRGATSLLLLLYFVILSFNPRTHEGCDSLAGKINEEELMFQSTHPRGVRQFLTFFIRNTKSFNPRTHEGCDGLTLTFAILARCFNPRTHEGCDLHCLTMLAISFCFNPRTHEGCDVRLGA